MVYDQCQQFRTRQGCWGARGAELGPLGKPCALWVSGHSLGCRGLAGSVLLQQTVTDAGGMMGQEGAAACGICRELGWLGAQGTPHPPPQGPPVCPKPTRPGHEIPEGGKMVLVGLQVNFSSTSWSEKLQELLENHLLLRLSGAGSQGCVGAGTARIAAAPLPAHTARALPGLPAAAAAAPWPDPVPTEGWDAHPRWMLPGRRCQGGFYVP